MQSFLSMADNRAVDNFAINACGIPGELLMGNAGKALVQAMSDAGYLGSGVKVLVLCGKGNNGGDGYVIASDLISRGIHTNILSVASSTDLTGDALHYFQALKDQKPNLAQWAESAEQKELFQSADIIVDALLGTGIKGALRAPYPRLIELSNASKALIVAVDVPSGMTGDLGQILDPCIHASLTVSMGYGKQGCLFEPARTKAGKVLLVEIGFPENSLEHINAPVLHRLEAHDFPTVSFQRVGDAHKYSTGKVFIMAGSRGFSGAGILSAKAALRTGAGLVKLGVPTSIGVIAESTSLETVVTYLPETSSQTFSYEALESAISEANWSDVTAIGPGIGRHPEVSELVLELTQRIERPLVLDADALFALTGNLHVLSDRKFPTILTPHVGEFKRLIGMGTDSVPVWSDAQEFAKTHGVYLLLKGGPSVLATPNGHVFVNSTGNPGMATAGSGDVLTGVLAALWGQWSTLPDILNFGMYIHGAAGDHKLGHKGVLGLTASDLIEGLPQVLKGYGGLPN